MVNLIQFKNKPLIVISDDEKPYRKIQFGINKAKLILENIEAIKNFVNSVGELKND